jgi:integrase
MTEHPKGQALPAPLVQAAAGQDSEAVMALLDGPAGAAVAGAAGRVLSENTCRAYAADWQAFFAWCAAGGVPALPATPLVVAGHLASLAGRLGRSGLRRRLAAIAEQHRRTGHPWEPGHPAIRATLHDILAAHAVPSRPAAALTSTEVRQLLDSCGTDLAGIRDRALLLVGFAGALRRSELVAIDREDLRLTSDGMTLRLPRSQQGGGAGLDLPRGQNPTTCPVRATEAWLQRARIEYGAVFRRVTAAGTLEDRLSPQGVWKILRRRAALARLVVNPGERLSPHGLRAGFIAEASQGGATEEQVMRHARRKGMAATQGSRRPARLLDL